MYSPTKIFSFDVDEGKKTLSPQLIQDNLENVSRETKSLGDSIKVNKSGIAINQQATEQNRQSFSKLFLDLN